MRQWIETASVGIELLAVVIIVGAVAFGSLRFLLDLSRRAADPYSVYKDLIGVHSCWVWSSWLLRTSSALWRSS
jgi:hypothetical protein